ncbi:MAG: hypothetical protein KF905_01000 [Flavobacteriales bacterium]|nr:hypothetical protein [Flavobacteriales bacterium]
MIQHLPHHRIDKERWDAWLRAASQPLWYAQSAVLDAVAPGWEALVDEQQGAIMPLVWNSKWGFHYLYQPFGLQRLGVFAPQPSADLFAHMLQAVPSRFKFWDINLEWCDDVPPIPGLVVQQRTNMVIPLDRDLDAIRAAYGQSHKRGLRKWSSGSGPEQMDVQAFLAMVRNSEQFGAWGVDQRQWSAFERMVHGAVERGEGSAWGIPGSSEDWEACGFFVNWKGTLIFLKGLGTTAGRSTFAMHRLIDGMMARMHGTCGLFDLAGGENAEMRRFYAGFGALPHLYLRTRVNRLPQPLRWYKQRNDGV